MYENFLNFQNIIIRITNFFIWVFRFQKIKTTRKVVFITTVQKPVPSKSTLSLNNNTQYVYFVLYFHDFSKWSKNEAGEYVHISFVNSCFMCLDKRKCFIFCYANELLRSCKYNIRRNISSDISIVSMRSNCIFWTERCKKLHGEVLIARHFMIILLFKKLCLIPTVSNINTIV